MFKTRIIKPELLDHAPPEIARANLADLVRLNRYFGGHSTIRFLFEQVASPQQAFTVLDVGAASGDTARFLQSVYPRARITSLDCNPVNLSAASHPKVLADAFQLPFAPDSFDFVLSSLFLHHFTSERVCSLLHDFHAISRRGVLIADLERHLFPALFLRFTKRLFRWGDITVHDGVVSFGAAFTKRELLDVARQAGLANARVHVHRPAFRLSLVSAKQQ